MSGIDKLSYFIARNLVTNGKYPDAEGNNLKEELKQIRKDGNRLLQIEKTKKENEANCNINIF